MAYNLPPSWDPGYALPDNVVDEGLERRAFVTRQLPRGTYDNPRVGPAGYAVPKYVMKEGYGQGTFTTKWQPSGTYDGPNIPNWLNQRPQVVRSQRVPGGGTAFTVQPLGDTPMPEPYESYGKQAAQILITRVAGLPAQRRAAAMKVILDKVDKTAWPRTQTIWDRYRRQGMPPAQAFPLALARAMSAGLAAEIIRAGQGRTAPQANSLLGLGCYGCMAALGATDFVSSVTGGPIRVGTTGTGASVDPTAVAPPNACFTSPGYTWVDAAGDIGGHWERTAAGLPDIPRCPNGPPPAGTTPTIITLQPVVRDPRTTGVQVSPTADFAYPFTFRADTPAGMARDFSGPGDITVFGPGVPVEIVDALSKASNLHVMRDIPTPWLAWMHDSITKPGDLRDKSFVYDPQADRQNAPDVASDIEYWYGRMGIAPGTQIWAASGWPQATIVWPLDKSTVGLWWLMDSLNPRKPKSATNPTVIKFFLSKLPDLSLERQVVQFFTRIYDAAIDALHDLGNLACGIFSGPAGPAAGAAASTAVGAGPAVGVAGAGVAKGACGMPPPVAPHSSFWPMALLAGGAVAAVAIVTRPRKKAP